MPESINPSFVKINYHSSFGPHVAEIPTLQWNSDNTFDTWAAGTISDSDMIGALVTDLLPFYPSTVEFDNYIIYNVPTLDADPQPVASGSFTGMTGSSGDIGWSKAAQGTFSIRTSLFGLFKLTMLDLDSGDQWSPSSALGGTALTLFDEVSDTGNGWAGRDNGRPNVFIRFTKTLNEKLRRAYRMT